MDHHSWNSLSVIACATVCSVACGVSGSDAKQAAARKSADAVKVEFFVMSQCPFGVQVVNGVKEAVDRLGTEVDFRLEFIGNKGVNGELASMHGADEVTGDMAQVCAAKHAPARFLDMVVCQNKNIRDVASNWEECAKGAGLPMEPIRACIQGKEGKELLAASFDRASARGARASPTMFINGKPYAGRRGSKDFIRAICAEHRSATKPAACQGVGELPKVNVTIIRDKRCADCNVDRIVNTVKNQLGAPQIKFVEYTEEEGRTFVEGLGVADPMLPMVLFDDSLQADSEAMNSMGRNLRPLGRYLALNVTASWNPVCANPGGCEQESCKNTLSCRKERPNTLELFVMSQCPFGVKALNSMEEVLRNFSNNIGFEVNYIASGSAASGFTALHGHAEVEENIRQLCAAKHQGKNHKYMEYILCRNKDIRSNDWEKCIPGGMDATVIKKCVEGGEGKLLLEASARVSSSLGVNASPTWIVNGRYKFSGVDAETIRKNLCAHNKGLKGCENTLSANTGAPVQGGCRQ